jgi:hypothetical protein
MRSKDGRYTHCRGPLEVPSHQVSSTIIPRHLSNGNLARQSMILTSAICIHNLRYPSAALGRTADIGDDLAPARKIQFLLVAHLLLDFLLLDFSFTSLYFYLELLLN